MLVSFKSSPKGGDFDKLARPVFIEKEKQSTVITPSNGQTGLSKQGRSRLDAAECMASDQALHCLPLIM